MALNFDNEIPEWKNEGAEPSEELREKGFTGGYKPPATVFNWFWSLVQKCVSELQSKLKSHADSTNNPHKVTKAQVGLGNVDNTSDVNKPVSNAVQTALDGKADNGHTHTLDDISETTSKKIMTAAERSKLNGIATGANKTVVDSTLSNTSTNPVQNKVVKAEFDFIYNDKLAPMEEDISTLNSNKANKSEIPTALKNPYALTVKVGNEENPTSYDGSSSVSISVDTTPTENSNNLITSGGVHKVLSEKAAKSHTHSASDILGNLKLDQLPRGAEGYILKGFGSNNSPVWSRPLIYRSAGGYSIVQSTQNNNNVAHGVASSAFGAGNTVTGTQSTAFNVNNTVEGTNAAAFGSGTSAKGGYSFTNGYNTIANGFQTVVGRMNIDTSAPTDFTDTTGSIFIVGTGNNVSGDSYRANGFRVGANSTCYGATAFMASGADFAEYFEWADGNLNNEDRRGLFVTLDGEKIRLANANDNYILGAVSSVPTITGDTQSETWKNMYLTDVFGERLTETIEVEETTDEDGNIIAAHTETRFVINPEYDDTMGYKSRDKRIEWAAVGLVGKLIVVDDGTCEVNGYCIATNGGVATKADTGYRVMARIDDTHIKILLK